MASKKELTDLAQQENKLAYLKVTKAKEAQAASFVQVENVGIGERDPDTGKYQTIFPNQGTSFNGNKIFNSSLPYGSKVRASQPDGFAAIALDHKRVKFAPAVIPEEKVEKKPEPPNIKVLFYIHNKENNSFDFYIGGDRPTPIKIFSSAQLPHRSYLSSLGRGLNDWVVGLQYIGRVINIYPGNNIYTFDDPVLATGYSLQWRGCGFWTYSAEFGYRKVNELTQVLEDSQYTKTTLTTADVLGSTPFLAGSGTYRHFATSTSDPPLR